MPSIHQAKSRMARLALKRNGVDVFVNGISYRVIYFVGEEESEVGYIKSTSFSFHADDIPHFQKGDSIYMNSALFKVEHVGDKEMELLIPVVVKRA